VARAELSASAGRVEDDRPADLGSVAQDLASKLKTPSTGASPGAASVAADTAGKLQEIPDLVRVDSERLFRLALAKACGSTDKGAKSVLWRDGDDEVVLEVSGARIATTDRLIVTSIPVFTDQSGAAEVVVPFVTSAADDAEGLIAATEVHPRGPAAIIDIFGEALVAVAWSALVETAAAWAHAAGEQAIGVGLAPAGLSATRSALRVRAQVRISRDQELP
jgi:hypothetical protein